MCVEEVCLVEWIARRNKYTACSFVSMSSVCHCSFVALAGNENTALRAATGAVGNITNVDPLTGDLATGSVSS